MADFLSGLGGLVKGLSVLMPQDDPAVKILQTRTELENLNKERNRDLCYNGVPNGGTRRWRAVSGIVGGIAGHPAQSCGNRGKGSSCNGGKGEPGASRASGPG